MGSRYTNEEISQIQALTQEGRTIKDLAEILGRPEAGIRNIRHRIRLKTKTKQTLKTLRTEEVISYLRKKFKVRELIPTTLENGARNAWFIRVT